MLLWILLIGVPILLGLYAQFRVSSAFHKNSQVGSRSGITGRQAAEIVLRGAGIHDVEIVQVQGMLSDHYDPAHKRLALSPSNYQGSSLAALGIAAHEAGHAIQHKVGYAMMSVRQTLAPVTTIAAPIAYLVCGFGIYLFSQMSGLLLIGIAALGVLTLFQLVTLPVEFDATRRAKAVLSQTGMITPAERPGVNETLDAAALTYIAAFVSSLGQLLYLVALFGGGNRRDD